MASLPQPSADEEKSESSVEPSVEPQPVKPKRDKEDKEVVAPRTTSLKKKRKQASRLNSHQDAEPSLTPPSRASYIDPSSADRLRKMEQSREKRKKKRKESHSSKNYDDAVVDDDNDDDYDDEQAEHFFDGDADDDEDDDEDDAGEVEFCQVKHQRWERNRLLAYLAASPR